MESRHFCRDSEEMESRQSEETPSTMKFSTRSFGGSTGIEFPCHLPLHLL